jgi:4a-hydroxytetrahydrobiopterin dehydratase
MTEPLTDAEITSGLDQRPGWALVDGQLMRQYKFVSFSAALTFMYRMAPGIDVVDHHPDWTNVYNTVTVRLSTHDAGGAVTQKDFTVAQLLDVGFDGPAKP